MNGATEATGASTRVGSRVNGASHYACKTAFLSARRCRVYAKPSDRRVKLLMAPRHNGVVRSARALCAGSRCDESKAVNRCVCVRFCVCVCEASLKDGRMSEPEGGEGTLRGVRRSLTGVTGGPTATRFEVDMRLCRSACDVHIRSHSRRWGASS